MPYYRNRTPSDEDDRPPGRWVSWLLLAVAGLSFAGAVVAAVLIPMPMKATTVASSVAGGAFFAGGWAILKNVRQMNAAVQEQTSPAESG